MPHLKPTIATVYAVAALGLTLSTVSAQQSPPKRDFDYDSGQDLYEHLCQGCHMPGGVGATGAASYPALANNPKLAAGMYPAMIVLRGYKSMPSYPGLTDKQVVEITNYVRTNFGNSYDDHVTVEQVSALRPNEDETGNQRPG